MKKQFTIQKRLMKNLVFFIIITLVLSYSSAFGYDLDSHYAIAEKSIKQSSLNDMLNHIGFNGYDNEITSSLYTRSIIDWIAWGSKWEDRIAYWNYGLLGNERSSLNCHFYNPITNKGYTNSEGNEIGQSLIDRANDTEVDIGGFFMNEWSYPMAKDLYYAALTGDSTKYSQWLIRAGMFPTVSFYGKENMNAEEREQFFAWTFQALGHTMHLIADASVPAHTRNDLHGRILWIGDPEPYEDWTESKAEFAKKNPGDGFFPGILGGEGSDPWTNWTQYPNIKVPDVFIDAGKLLNVTTPPITDLDQGLAEYSHANFLSADTVFGDGNSDTISTLHGLDDVGIDDVGNLVFKEDREIDTETYSFYYVKNNTAQIDHFVLCGIAWHIKQMEFMSGQTPDTNILFTVDDPLVNNDYASKLLPRAVGYSAGLLDYFFRGSIKISLPDTGVYALTDKDPSVTEPSDPRYIADPSTEGFDRIQLLAENTSSNSEQMTGGTLKLVIKYRVAQENQFQNDPPAPDAEFQYIVKELAETTIPKDASVLLDVDLSETPIPLWATDVYLYLVYKGALGNENEAVAAGFKDISEPTPLAYYNSMDKICIKGVMYNTGNEALAKAIEEGKENEWDVYPHDRSDVYIKYSSVDSPQTVTSDNYTYRIPYQVAGEYTTLILLTDYEYAHNYTKGVITPTEVYQQQDTFSHDATNPAGVIFTLNAIKNQYEDIRITPQFHQFREIENSWMDFSFMYEPLPEDDPENVNCSF